MQVLPTQVQARERLEGSPEAYAQKESECAAFTQVDRQLLRSLQPPQWALRSPGLAHTQAHRRKKVPVKEIIKKNKENGGSRRVCAPVMKLVRLKV